jgi:hypothetical protein
MKIFFLTILSALSISIIGGYFSILGLSTIFPGSKYSVIIMGAALEVGKLVTVLWLHKNWAKTKFLMKLYFSFAVFVLMSITSLGIFGFLSKSHIEHKSQANQELSLIDNLNVQIEYEQNSINQYKNQIEKLEKKEVVGIDIQQKEIDREQSRIDALSKKLKDDIEIEIERINRLEKSKEVLDIEIKELESKKVGLFSNKKKLLEELRVKQEGQRQEIKNKINIYNENIKIYRENYNKEYSRINQFIENIRLKDNNLDIKQKEIEECNEYIRSSFERIDSLKKEKNNLGETIRRMETEIGPLKYFLEALNDSGFVSLSPDQAVRVIIIIIMLVFDPLAILLVLAAQISFINSKERVNKTYKKLKNKINEETAGTTDIKNPENKLDVLNLSKENKKEKKKKVFPQRIEEIMDWRKTSNKD